MALSAEQVEVVREISMLKSIAVTLSYTDALSAEQQARVIDIVDNEWPKVRFAVGHLVPNKGDILNSQIEKRRLIIHTVRLMLGLDPVSDEEIAMAELDGTYGAVVGGAGGKGDGRSGIGEFGVISTTSLGNRRSGTSEVS